MLTGFHGVVVDVGDFDAAVRDYALLLGRAPTASSVDADHRVRNARFVLANAELELRALAPATAGGEGSVAREPALPIRGTAGIAGLRFDWRAAPGSRRLPGRLEGPTIPIELVAESDRAGEAIGSTSSLARTPAPTASAFSAIDPDAQVAGLDHVVIVSPQAERTRRYFAEELGIRLALDRSFPERGLRLLFFRLGGVTLEVASALAANPSEAGGDAFQGLAWKVTRIEAIQARLRDGGFDVSEIRGGHKVGTRVATVRGPVHGVPTLLIEHPPRDTGAEGG